MHRTFALPAAVWVTFFAIALALFAGVEGPDPAAAEDASFGPALETSTGPLLQAADSDGDGFTDDVEVFIGTDPFSSCGVEAWPPDVNDDFKVNLLDVFAFRGPFGTSVGGAGYLARVDLNASGSTNLLDVFLLRPDFGTSCSPGPGNSAPVLDPVGAQTIVLGTSLDLTLSATDANGDPITFGASPLPLEANMTLNGMSGDFAFRPDASQEGCRSLTFSVADDQGAVDSELVPICVERDPAQVGTSLAGRVFDLDNDRPVEGVTVSLLVDPGNTTATDADGMFQLDAALAGEQELVLDPPPPSSSDPSADVYAEFRLPVRLIAGVLNVLDADVILTELDHENAVAISPTVDTEVTTPNLPDVSLTIVAGTAKNEDGSTFSGSISITQMPSVAILPALPARESPAQVLTIQTVEPGDVTFATPAPITLPNLDNLRPGERVDFHAPDMVTGEFVIVGQGEVSADGTVIETISGGVATTGWEFFGWSPASPPFTDPATQGDQGNSDDPDSPCKGTGSAMTLCRGALRVTHVLPATRSFGATSAPTFRYFSNLAHPQVALPIESVMGPWRPIPETFTYGLEVGGVLKTSLVVHASSLLADPIADPKPMLVTLTLPPEPEGLAASPVAVPTTLTIRNNYAVSWVETATRDRSSSRTSVRVRLAQAGFCWGCSGYIREPTVASSSPRTASRSTTCRTASGASSPRGATTRRLSMTAAGCSTAV